VSLRFLRFARVAGKFPAKFRQRGIRHKAGLWQVEPKYMKDRAKVWSGQERSNVRTLPSRGSGPTGGIMMAAAKGQVLRRVIRLRAPRCDQSLSTSRTTVRQGKCCTGENFDTSDEHCPTYTVLYRRKTPTARRLWHALLTIAMVLPEWIPAIFRQEHCPR
jgi:hypothetical protein